MAINYNDPYNQGIGTLDVGNINQGQNIQTAGAWGAIMPEFMGGYSEEEIAQNEALEKQNEALEKIEGLRINQMKGIPKGKTEVETQSIINDLQYTNPDKLKEYKDIEKQIQNLKKQFPQNIDIQQASLDDEYADIEDQTAMIDPFSIIGMIKAGYSKKKIAQYLAQEELRKAAIKKFKPVFSSSLTGGFTDTVPGPTNINIQKKNIGMPEHLTMGGGQSNQGPGGRARDRGRSRGRGETGQIAGGHHFKYGGRASYFDGGLLSLWPR